MTQLATSPKASTPTPTFGQSVAWRVIAGGPVPAGVTADELTGLGLVARSWALTGGIGIGLFALVAGVLSLAGH